MSLPGPESRSMHLIKAALDNELNKILGRFYQDLVLREIPSPETHIAKLREILEGKTQSGT